MPEQFNISTLDIINKLKRSCDIPDIVEAIASEKIIAEAAAKAGIDVTEAELQQEGEKFSLERKLATAKDTWAWLDKHHLSIKDFEQLVLYDWNHTKEAKLYGKVKRAICLPKVDLTNSSTNSAAHISLVIVPEIKDNQSKASEELKQKLWDWLDKRRLLTTRHHVVEPSYLKLQIRMQLFLEDGASAKKVKDKAINEIKEFFHPLNSGKYWNVEGFPFGQNIFLSDIYRLLETLPGVNYLEGLTLIPDDAEETNIKTKTTQVNSKGNNKINVKKVDSFRSEERRVGKECRSRWSPYH